MSQKYEEDDFYNEENLETVSDELSNSGDISDSKGSTSSFEEGGEGDDFYSEENLESVSDELSSVENNINDSEGEEEPKPKTYSMSIGDMGEVEDVEEPKPRTFSMSVEGMDLEMEDSDDDEDDILTPEERLRGFADSIMSCCFGEKEIRQHALDKLMLISTPQLFRDENYILFSVLYKYRGRLKKINITEEFLKIFLNRNRKMLEESKGFIDINAYGEVDGSVELGYISGVLKHFKRLVSMEELSEVDFETTFEKYLIEFKNLEAERVLKQSQIILTNGLTVGRKRYFGFDDSSSFVKRRFAEIEGITNMQKGSGFITDREMLLNEKPTNKSYKVSDFDEITSLNAIYGGIYTGMFYQFIAPPKSGKTKLCARIAHTTKVKFGNNITVWAKEGGKEAFMAQVRAIHFDYIYNTGVGITEKKFGVSQDVILKDNFPTNELRQLELSSKLDLASNQDYGTIDYIDRPLEIETFIEDLDTSVKSNNSSVVIIDYLQLMGTATNIDERSRVADAYRLALDYCKTNNIALISPGQYKQEVLERLLSMSSTAGAEMRTAGGSSAEVTRTPDILFALWASTQDLENNRMKILSMPGRFSKVFPEIELVTDLETCHFIG